jgi:hypothetical protein
LFKQYLLISVHGPGAPDGEIDARCVRTNQDTKQQKSCPAGQVSMTTALKRLAGFDVGDEETDGGDGVFTMPIFRQDLSIHGSSLSVSYGSLSEPTLKTKSENVVVRISASDAVVNDTGSLAYKVNIAEKLDLVPDRISGAKTPGKLFNNAGKAIYQTGAPLPVSGDFILLREPVNGNVTVSYTVTGFEQELSISPREEQPDNNYQSTLYVVSSCGQVLGASVEVPQCWQEDYRNKSGGGVTVIVDDPPPEAEPRDLKLNWDECSLELNGGDDGIFDDLPGSGPIYYPGTRTSPGCG